MSRLLDIVMALLVLIVFLPLGLVISAILRLTGEGEIFFLQDRVGQGGRRFKLFKFATMLKNSPNMGTGTVTIHNDPRVLPFGKLLRKTKLNEVPQFWNVLRGDMGLVGPRPLTAQTFECYPVDARPELLKARPGLTGVGSIVFRDEESLIARSGKDPLACYREDVAPYKCALELWYLRRRSVAIDVGLVLLTAIVIVKPSSRAFLRFLKGIPAAPPALQSRKAIEGA